RLASSNQLILVDNRGIGRSTDNGQPFDIAKLADDTARVIEALGIERVNVLGWSMGGFIAQTLALQQPARIHKVILLSTDGGADADLASAEVWSQLIECPGRPTSRRADYCRCFFRVTSPNPFIANSAIS